MNKQQTAVEWIVNELLLYKNPTNINGTDYILIPRNKIEHLKDKAKEMEKEQIINSVDGFPLPNRGLNGDDYYSETYGGN